jgi:ubiquinone/menaquinone biosynthesis C-methylase UbiE
MKCIKPFTKENDISIFLSEMNKDQRHEDDFFKNSTIESDSVPAYKSLMHKMQSLQFFNDIIGTYGITLQGTLLELGGGYGYLSAYIKAEFPSVVVVYSDVSITAVRKSRQFEDVFKSTIDEKWVLAAEQTPFAENQFDFILFNASFHHLQDPQSALFECSRLLKSTGKLLLLMEPSCPGYLKPFYNAHVERDQVRENFYSQKEYRKMLGVAGFRSTNYCYKNFLYRWSSSSMLYYLGLSLLPGIAGHLLPCTQVIVGERSTSV